MKPKLCLISSKCHCFSNDNWLDLIVGFTCVFSTWKWDDDPQWRAYVEIGLIAPIRSCRAQKSRIFASAGIATPLNQAFHALSQNLPRMPGSLILMAYKPYFIKCSSHLILKDDLDEDSSSFSISVVELMVFHRCSTSWFISIIINKYIHKYDSICT